MWVWTGLAVLCVGMELSEVHRVAKEVVEAGKRLERVR